MPGFIITLGDKFRIPEESNPHLFISTFQGDGYQVSRRTCKKFMNDKIVEDNDQFLLLIEGVIVNSRDLIKKYNARDWRECVLSMRQLNPEVFYKEFRGSFCGFVLEKSTKRWLFFTDHIGSKQVFYSQVKEGFVIGTEISYMIETLKENGVSLTLNRDAAYMDLTLGYVIEDNTLYNEIHKLCAGHYLTLTENDLQEKQYHRFSNEPKEMTLDEAIEGIDHFFREAVRLDFEKDREYGYKHWATLSGGLDSRMTVWVAHDLGYTQQLNLNFGQSESLDFKVGKQIATDLRHDFLFKALDNGNCIYSLDKITELTGGSACFFGVSHTRSLFDKINYSDYGIIHTGEMGDGHLGCYMKSELDKLDRLNIMDGGYSIELADRLKDYQLKYPYKDREIFMTYNEGFCFTGQGTLGYDHNYTEALSPFCNVEFIEFCYSIPIRYRFKHKIYFDWVLNKYPGAAKYVWTGHGHLIQHIDNEDKTRYMTVFGNKVPHFSDPAFPTYLKGFVLRRLGLRKKTEKPDDKHTFTISDKNHMHPVDYWYANNPDLKSFMDNYWNENKDLVKDPQLKEDMRYLYEDCVAVYDKMQVLTVLSAIKKFL
jgi:asparagine synthase (glutamine-hydrolysing)